MQKETSLVHHSSLGSFVGPSLGIKIGMSEGDKDRSTLGNILSETLGEGNIDPPIEGRLLRSN